MRSSSLLEEGHAWLEFEGNNPDYEGFPGRVTSFSTWGNLGTQEFWVDKESEFLWNGQKTYTINVTFKDLQKIFDFNSNQNNINWSLTNNCAGYTSALWNAVTKEIIDYTGIVMTPEDILYYIDRKQREQNH